MNRAELKAAAKQQIKGKIGILFVITLIISVISIGSYVLLSFIPFIGSLAYSIIIGPAFGLSVFRVFLTVTKGGNPDVKDAFCGFDDFWSAFKVTFLVGLFTYLWSLLFIIPGIIKSISYSMAPYILAENKGKPALECINESKAMTKGHKMDLFVLGLSFIGWILLGSVTFGIAFIWVVPYMEVTLTNAYLYLKAVRNPEVITDAVIEESTSENNEN